MKRFVLHIDRLVLQGFDGVAPALMADTMQADLQAELSRLLAEPGAIARLTATSSAEKLCSAANQASPTPAVSAGVAAARAIAQGAR